MKKNRRKIIYTIIITAVMIILAAGFVTLYVVLEETIEESGLKIQERDEEIKSLRLENQSLCQKVRPLWEETLKSWGTSCPKCHSTDVSKILYGLYDNVDSLLANEKVILAGCIEDDFSNHYYCNNCSNEWGNYADFIYGKEITTNKQKS